MLKGLQQLSPRQQRQSWKLMSKKNIIFLKKLLCFKGINENVKRQHTEWEKVFAKHILDKGLMSGIYKELYNSTTRRQSN